MVGRGEWDGGGEAQCEAEAGTGVVWRLGARKKQRPPLGPLATTMGDLRHAGLAALGRLDGCSEWPQTLLPV